MQCQVTLIAEYQYSVSSDDINMKEAAVFLQNLVQGGAGVNIDVREGRGRCLVANKQIEVSRYVSHVPSSQRYDTSMFHSGGRRGAGGDPCSLGSQAVVSSVLCSLLLASDVHQHSLVQAVQSPPL